MMGHKRGGEICARLSYAVDFIEAFRLKRRGEQSKSIERCQC